jgi:acyl carrier protein
MNDEQLTSIVVDCVREVSATPHAHVSTSRHLLEAGIDSLLAVELLVSLEARLGIEIPDDVVYRLKCVDEIVRYLRPRLDEAEAPLPLCGT